MQPATSGNPTNDGYFLDSCIYINYGVPEDTFHAEAVTFFCKTCPKHTSETVLSELAGFKAFMARFGRDLNKAVGGKDKNLMFKHPWLVFQGYNQNQQSVIAAFLETVKGRLPLLIQQEYASLKGLVSDSIQEALSKTCKPYIIQSKDLVFLKNIEFVKDEGDKQIVADAALWASGFNNFRFCTTDREHILKNKVDLENIITRHYGRNCLIFTHLEMS
jgi:hypothetical protein